jgi:hypothetical protein
MQQRYVAIFTSASCCGWAFAFDATPQEAAALQPLVEDYNSMARWQKRNCDGSAEVNELSVAVARHADAWESEEPVTDEKSLLAFFESDGQGRPATRDEVERFLLSDAWEELPL